MAFIQVVTDLTKQNSMFEPQEPHQEEASRLDPRLDPNSFPLDRYQPIKQIGIGANGSVYLCVDRQSQDPVAIKILHNLHDEQFRSFETEARTMTEIKHPNIVELLAYGATPAGLPYLCLEYFPGTRLSDYIEARGRLPIKIALMVFASLADALFVSHSNRILHRDVSPGNVLVAAEKSGRLEVKLIDFGVAQMLDELAADTSHDDLDNDRLQKIGTTSGSFELVGTPAYMPPDVPHGLPYDERSEIYALGCMLFEALTGVVPFLGRSAMETINMHALNPPPTLAEAGQSEFDRRLESIVAICLAKDPEHRYQSMEHLCSALKSLMET